MADGFVHYVPSRLSALCFLASALFIPSCHPLLGLQTLALHSRRLAGAACGCTFAAAAGALGATLAGPHSRLLGGRETPWVGHGAPASGPRDLLRALMLYGISLQWLLLMLAGGRSLLP